MFVCSSEFKDIRTEWEKHLQHAPHIVKLKCKVIPVLLIWRNNRFQCTREMPSPAVTQIDHAVLSSAQLTAQLWFAWKAQQPRNQKLKCVYSFVFYKRYTGRLAAWSFSQASSCTAQGTRYVSDGGSLKWFSAKQNIPPTRLHPLTASELGGRRREHWEHQAQRSPCNSTSWRDLLSSESRASRGAWSFRTFSHRSSVFSSLPEWPSSSCKRYHTQLSSCLVQNPSGIRRLRVLHNWVEYPT